MAIQPFDERISQDYLKVDRSTPVGVSNDGTERGALHTKIKNLISEPIPVAIVSGGGGGGGGSTAISYPIENYFNEVTIAPNTESIVVSKTNTTSSIIYLTETEFDGDQTAEYSVYIGATQVAKKRTYFGSALNGMFLFSGASNSLGLAVNPGQTVYLKAKHTRSSSGDFSGSLHFIEIAAAATSTLNFYGSIGAVSSGVLSTIAAFTVPSTGIVKLIRIDCSGNNIAEFQVLEDTAMLSKKRTYFGGDLNCQVDYSGADRGGLVVTNSSVIYVKVTHFRAALGDFEANIVYTME